MNEPTTQSELDAAVLYLDYLNEYTNSSTTITRKEELKLLMKELYDTQYKLMQTQTNKRTVTTDELIKSFKQSIKRKN
jgi:hypothetical protein